jgi:ParB family transcriptional regulator, chromosome partitioning protein
MAPRRILLQRAAGRSVRIIQRRDRPAIGHSTPVTIQTVPASLKRRSPQRHPAQPEPGLSPVGAASDDQAVPEASGSAVELRALPLAAVRVSRRNPRRKLSGITELAASLQTHGLLQPVIVRTIGDHYELVAGHRRLEAARQLGWAAIPAIIRTDAEETAYVLTVIENLQRENLSPREEAEALEVLVRERGWSTRQVAAGIHRSQAFVSKRLRVFEDPILAPAVLANRLSVSAAEELLSAGEGRRYVILQEAIDRGWDRAQVRHAVLQQVGVGANHSRRTRAFARRARELRIDLRDVRADDLTKADVRELRLLFTELAMLARAKPGAQRVFPPLPTPRSAYSS